MAKVIGFDEYSLPLHNKKLSFRMPSSIPTIETLPSQSLQNILSKIATPNGLSDLNIIVHLKPEIKVFGVPIYSGLSLSKALPVGSVTSSLTSVSGVVERLAEAIDPASFPPTGNSTFNIRNLAS